MLDPVFARNDAARKGCPRARCRDGAVRRHRHAVRPVRRTTKMPADCPAPQQSAIARAHQRAWDCSAVVWIDPQPTVRRLQLRADIAQPSHRRRDVQDGGGSVVPRYRQLFLGVRAEHAWPTRLMPRSMIGTRLPQSADPAAVGRAGRASSSIGGHQKIQRGRTGLPLSRSLSGARSFQVEALLLACCMRWLNSSRCRALVRTCPVIGDGRSPRAGQAEPISRPGSCHRQT